MNDTPTKTLEHVRQYLQTSHLQRRQRTIQGFRHIYTLADIRLLAQTDELHGTLSGPATKKRDERAWTHFGQTAYHRLAGISVAYLCSGSMKMDTGLSPLRSP